MRFGRGPISEVAEIAGTCTGHHWTKCLQLTSIFFRTAPHGGVIFALKIVKSDQSRNRYFRAKTRAQLQRLSYAVINHWHLQATDSCDAIQFCL